MATMRAPEIVRGLMNRDPKYLRPAREGAGITIVKAAQMMGCSDHRLGQYELGKRSVPDEYFDYYLRMIQTRRHFRMAIEKLGTTV